MTNAGLLRGHYDGTFAPEMSITRGEFATVLSRFTEATYSGPNLFGDIDNHWSANYINIAVQEGWLRGDGNGDFRPDDPLTRAEVSAALNRMLNRTITNIDDLLEGRHIWPDNSNQKAWYYLDIEKAANSADYERLEGSNVRWIELWPHFDFTFLERPNASATDVFPARLLWQEEKAVRSRL
jgi:hypothetical protein